VASHKVRKQLKLMSISLLGGQCRGFVLLLPPENITRPTAAQLKRRIFDSCQDLSGYTFIDLCAGSGSIGLEALSRGSDDVYFVEKNRKASQVLKKNIDNIYLKYPTAELSSTKVFEEGVESWFKKHWSSDFINESCIIYLDPPYELIGLYKYVIEFLQLQGFQGELWLEGCRQKGVTFQEWVDASQCSYKVYEQGTSYILRLMFCS
jgi:16S rRNA (guanine966-N2)-methyltransferase